MSRSRDKPLERAAPFCETRKHHSTEAAEDYTELIADLIEKHGEARTGEIAKQMGISHVTALRTIRRLQEEGYMKTSRNQPVVLTAKGRQTAHYARDRHQLLVEFFVSIGVPLDIAEVDVEGAEHHISSTTLECVSAFLKKTI